MPDISLTMSNKPPKDQVLDEQGNEVDIILDEHGNPAAPPTPPSTMPGSGILNWLTTPAYPLGEKINELEHISSADPTLNRQFQSEESSRLLEDAKLNEIIPYAGNVRSMMRGFFRGTEEAAAPGTSQLTSPAGAATAIAGGLEGPLAKRAVSTAATGTVQGARQLWKLAQMANLTRRAASVPYAIQGAEKVYSEPTAMGKLGGATEAILGGLGTRGKLTPPSQIIRGPRTGRVVSEPPRAPGNLLGSSEGGGAGARPTDVPPPPFTEGEFRQGSTAPKYENLRKDEVPNFYNSSGEHTPSFANDVDRAMWMVSELKPSRKYTEYLDFVKKTTGLPTDRAVQMSVDFGKFVKMHLKQAGPGVTPVPETYGSEEWNTPSAEPSKMANRYGEPTSTGVGRYGNEALEGMNKGDSKFGRKMKELKAAQDIAYRAGDTKKAVELGQAMQELDNLMYNDERKGPPKYDPSEPSRMADPNIPVPQDEWIRMEVGEREDMLRNQIGQYAEHGARVANKELLQNALDVLTNPDGTGMPHGKVSVDLDYHGTATGKGPSISVTDNGTGLPIEMIRNQYMTLTGSGKRGQGQYIGEMGVGKATYLLGADSFEVDTTAVEPDGSTWRYQFGGVPEDLITGQVKINKQQVPNGTPTGTKVTIYDSDPKNITEAQKFLKIFAAYSNSPVEVTLKGNEQTNQYLQSLNLNEVVQPRSPGPSRPVGMGSGPGGDFRITVPDDATWMDRTKITMVLNNRGMFQGAQDMYTSKGTLPDIVVVDIQPTVPASDGKRYPLTSPTREKMKDPFRKEVEKVINKDLVEKAKKKREDDMQIVFDSLRPAQGRGFVLHDSGGRLTPSEVNDIVRSVPINRITAQMKMILDLLDTKFTDQLGKTKKYGLFFGDMHNPGLNAVNPASRALGIGNIEFAIMINPLSIIGKVFNENGTTKQAANLLVHAIAHEFNHNRVRAEGGDFTFKLFELFGKFDLEEQRVYRDAIHQAITGPNGGFSQEILTLLQKYLTARGRQDTTVDLLSDARASEFLTESEGQGSDELSSEPSRIGTTGPDNIRQPGPGENKYDTYRRAIAAREYYELPRGLTAAFDLSAPLRQGKWLIGTNEWNSALGKMISAAWSEGNYDGIMQHIETIPTVKNGVQYRAGVHLTDLSNQPSRREEFLKSVWAETGEMLPKELQPFYKKTIGRGVRASNRAYTAFLNVLRAEYFQTLYENMPKDQTNNWDYLKQMAQFVNDATGRGKYAVGTPGAHIPIGRGSSVPAEINLEHLSAGFNFFLYSGRNMMSNIRMLSAPLNPGTYTHLPKQIRQEYLKSFLRYAIYAYAMNRLYKYFGAKTETDPRSSDFLKSRFGSVRMDPGGGNQQLLTLAAKLASGKYKSTTSGKMYELGKGFKAETRKDVWEQFLTPKLHPWWKFIYDLADASDFKPFSMADRTLQQFIPMLMGDLAAIYQANPKLLLLLGPATFGQGAQTYEKGTDKPVFTPVIAEALGKAPGDIDYKFKGGPIPKVGKYLNTVMDKMAKYKD